MKLPTWTYLIVFLGGIFLAWYWMRGCDDKDSYIEKVQDSLNIERKLNDTIRVSAALIMRTRDSVVTKSASDSIRYTNKIDSLQKAYNKLQSKFSLTKDSIGKLKIDLDNLAPGSNDIRLKEVVSRLDEQLTDANNQLFAIQINRDSASTAKDSEIVRLNIVITELRKELDALKSLVILCNTNADKMGQQTQVLINKSKKQKLIAKISQSLNVILGFLLILKK